MGRVFQRPFEPSHFHTIGHIGGAFVGGKGNEAEVTLALKTLKAADSGRSDLKCSKL